MKIFDLGHRDNTARGIYAFRKTSGSHVVKGGHTSCLAHLESLGRPGPQTCGALDVVGGARPVGRFT